VFFFAFYYRENLDALNVIIRLGLVLNSINILFFLIFVKTYFRMDFFSWDTILVSCGCFLFAIGSFLETPLFLTKELVPVSSNFNIIRIGIFFHIGGGTSFIILLYSWFLMMTGYLKHRGAGKPYPMTALTIALTIWIVSGIGDYLTVIHIIDLPPLSWLGAVSVIVVAAINFSLKIESLYEEISHDTFRYGGDEFILMFENAHNEKMILASVKRIHSAINTDPLSLDNQPVTVSCSLGIGIVPYRHGELTNDMMIAAADKALYESKAKGKNKISVAYVESL
jgi:hypothetical protein